MTQNNYILVNLHESRNAKSGSMTQNNYILENLHESRNAKVLRQAHYRVVGEITARVFWETTDNQDNLLTKLSEADFILFESKCYTFPHRVGEDQNKILPNIKPERTHRCRKEFRIRICSFTYQTV